MVLFFNDTATTEIYTLSLHDALPIYPAPFYFDTQLRINLPSSGFIVPCRYSGLQRAWLYYKHPKDDSPMWCSGRSEEHTSELQSRQYLVCRLLLEKKKNKRRQRYNEW